CALALDDATCAGELDGARLRGVASEQPDALEVREVGVHGGGRGEADLLADLAHGGRVAVAVHVGHEELPDLLLARGQCGLDGHGDASWSGAATVCSSRRVRILPDGVKRVFAQSTAGTPQPLRWRRGLAGEPGSPAMHALERT